MLLVGGRLNRGAQSVFATKSVLHPWGHRCVSALSRGQQVPPLLVHSVLLYLPALNDAKSLLRTFLLEGLSRKQLMQPLLLICGTHVQWIIKPQAFSSIPN